MSAVRAFWCDTPNFGDALNVELFRALGGLEIEPASEDTAEVAGIGSVLDRFLCDADMPWQKRRPIRVFSSGFGFGPGGYRRHRPTVLDPERMRRRVKCFAVRGLKTADRLRSFFPGIDVGTVGDGGLLAKFIPCGPVDVKYGVGIVPHYADRADPVFERLAHDVPGAVVLDPREGVIPFLRHLRECRTVISTAMHPLIACDALGIPNRWIRISEDTTSRFKFEDYYSIYGAVPEPLDPRVCAPAELSEEAIRTHYAIPSGKVAETQERLMASFNRLCRDLRRPQGRPVFLPSLVRLAASVVPDRDRRRTLRRKWTYEYC